MGSKFVTTFLIFFAFFCGCVLSKSILAPSPNPPPWAPPSIYKCYYNQSSWFVDDEGETFTFIVNSTGVTYTDYSNGDSNGIQRYDQANDITSLSNDYSVLLNGAIMDSTNTTSLWYWTLSGEFSCAPMTTKSVIPRMWFQEHGSYQGSATVGGQKVNVWSAYWSTYLLTAYVDIKTSLAVKYTYQSATTGNIIQDINILSTEVFTEPFPSNVFGTSPSNCYKGAK